MSDDYTNTPIHIDWGKESKSYGIGGKNAGGDCFLLPVEINGGGVNYVLLDSGLVNTVTYISNMWNSIKSKSPNSKIIGVVLSHYDDGYSAGLKTKLLQSMLVDLKFFASGYTFGHQELYDTFHNLAHQNDICYDDEASKKVYNMTNGMILLRKWDIGHSITLTTYNNHSMIPSPTTVTDLNHNNVIIDTIPSKENLASLITVYFGFNKHYVFTGGSLLHLVETFIRFLPRSPAIAQHLYLVNGWKEWDEIYDKFFKFNIQNNLVSNTNDKYKEYMAVISQSNWHFLQLPHHGSVRNLIQIPYDVDNTFLSESFYKNTLSTADNILSGIPVPQLFTSNASNKNGPKFINGIVQNRLAISPDTLNDEKKVSKFSFQLKEKKLGDSLMKSELNDTFSNIFDKIFTGLKSKEFKWDDLTIGTFQGTNSGDKVDQLEQLNLGKIQELNVQLKYQPSNNIFKWINLESTTILMKFEKDESNLFLMNLIVSGNFKFNSLSSSSSPLSSSSSPNLSVSIDMNVTGECLSIGFSKINNNKLSLSNLVDGLKESKIIGADKFIDSINLNDNIGFIGSLADLIPSHFAIFINRSTLKFAGLELSVAFNDIELSDNFALKDSTISLEHINENSSAFSYMKMTRVGCTFTLSKVESTTSTTTEIGKLYASFEKSSYTSLLNVSVKLPTNQTLVETIGYFINGFDKPFKGLKDKGLKSFLKVLEISDFGLGIDFKEKSIDNFHINISTTKPISVFGTSFKLESFILSFNSGQANSLSLSSRILIGENILNSKECKSVYLTIKRVKLNGIISWRLESTYKNPNIRTMGITDLIENKDHNDEESFFDQIQNQFALEQVQILLDINSLNKRVLFYTSAGAIQFAIGYMDKKLNAFFLFHLNLKKYSKSIKDEATATHSRNSNKPNHPDQANLENDTIEKRAPHLIGDDIISKLKKIDFILSNELTIKFMYTSNLPIDTLSQLFNTGDNSTDISKFIKEYFTLESNVTLLEFKCESSMINSFRNNFKPSNSVQTLLNRSIIFRLKKSGSSEFSLSASYECSKEPIHFGKFFSLNNIEISVAFSTNITLALTVSGKITNGPELMGTIGGEISPTGPSIILELRVSYWKQPLSIKWLFIDNIILGGGINLALVTLDSISVGGSFYIIPLELQNTIKDSKDQPKDTIYKINENEGAHLNCKLVLKLPAYFDIDFTIEKVDLSRVVRDILSRDIESDTLKNIKIPRASLKCSDSNNHFLFECCMNANFNGYGMYIYCLLSTKGVSDLELTGALSPISILNGSLMIGNSAFIGITNLDEEIIKEIKEIEKGILSKLPQKERELFENGPAIDLKLSVSSKTASFNISSGLKIFDCKASVTISLSTSQLFINSVLSIGNSFKIHALANLQKDSFKFSSAIEWNVKIRTPEVSLFGKIIFNEHSYITKLSGSLSIIIDSSGLSIGGHLYFKFNDSLEINITSFQIRTSSFMNICNEIVKYIYNNFKKLLMDAIKTVGNFISYIGKKSIKKICLIGKEIGKTANEMKDWLLTKFHLKEIMKVLEIIYKLEIGEKNNKLVQVNVAVQSISNAASYATIKFPSPLPRDQSQMKSSKQLSGVRSNINITMDGEPDGGVRPNINIAIDGEHDFPFDGYINKSEEPFYSINGMVIKFADQIDSPININEFMDYQELVDNVKTLLFEHQNSIKRQINFVPLSTDFQLLQELMFKSIGSDSDKVIISNFVKLWQSFDKLSEILCTGCLGEHNILPVSITNSNNNNDISNNLIQPIISIILSIILIYIEIQPLLSTSQILFEFYKNTPTNLLKSVAKLNTLLHINSRLINNIGGNGSLVKIGQDYYVIFDSRLHLVSNSIFSEKSINDAVPLNENPTDSNSIQIGVSLKGLSIVKGGNEYYLLLNQVLRKIDDKIIEIGLFNKDSLAEASGIDIKDYFIGLPIEIYKSYLQGFGTGVNNGQVENEQYQVGYEVGSITISSMFNGSIVEIKETGYYILKVSDKLYFRIDKEIQPTARKFKNIDYKQFRLSIDQIPKSIVSDIFDMIDTLKNDKIKFSELPLVEPVTTLSNSQIIQQQLQVESIQVVERKLTIQDIEEIPLINTDSRFVYFDHGQVDENKRFQNYYKTVEYLFPLDNLTSYKLIRSQDKELNASDRQSLTISSIFLEIDVLISPNSFKQQKENQNLVYKRAITTSSSHHQSSNDSKSINENTNISDVGYKPIYSNQIYNVTQIYESSSDLLIDLLRSQKTDGSWNISSASKYKIFNDEEMPSQLNKELWATFMVASKILVSYSSEILIWGAAIKKSIKFIKLQLKELKIDTLYDDFFSKSKSLITNNNK